VGGKLLGLTGMPQVTLAPFLRRFLSHPQHSPA
jgi:hypothetical protein